MLDLEKLPSHLKTLFRPIATALDTFQEEDRYQLGNLLKQSVGFFTEQGLSWMIGVKKPDGSSTTRADLATDVVPTVVNLNERLEAVMRLIRVRLQSVKDRPHVGDSRHVIFIGGPFMNSVDYPSTLTPLLDEVGKHITLDRDNCLDFSGGPLMEELAKIEPEKYGALLDDQGRWTKANAQLVFMRETTFYITMLYYFQEAMGGGNLVIYPWNSHGVAAHKDAVLARLGPNSNFEHPDIFSSSTEALKVLFGEDYVPSPHRQAETVYVMNSMHPGVMEKRRLETYERTGILYTPGYLEASAELARKYLNDPKYPNVGIHDNVFIFDNSSERPVLVAMKTKATEGQLRILDEKLFEMIKSGYQGVTTAQIAEVAQRYTR